MMGLSSMIASVFRGSDTPEATGESSVSIDPETHDPTKAWSRLSIKQTVKSKKLLSPTTPIHPDKVRFVCVSDTHNRMPLRVSVPDGDVLLHAGDFSMIGRPAEIESFNTWLGSLPHKHKIVIAGNHDLSFDEEMMKDKNSVAVFGLDADLVEAYKKEKGITHMKEVLTNCTFLQDSETTVCGIRIYGSPWSPGFLKKACDGLSPSDILKNEQPEFCDWGFNLPRGQPCLDKWNKIPEGIDILVTHGPPIGHGDLCQGGQRAGCIELLNTIQKRVKCKYHVFGHIHEGYGVTTDDNTVYINAATCTLNYRTCNNPILFDIPLPPGVSKEDFISGATPAEAEGTAPQMIQPEEPAERTETETANNEKDMDVDLDEVNITPLVLNQDYQLENTRPPHSSTSTESSFKP